MLSDSLSDRVVKPAPADATVGNRRISSRRKWRDGVSQHAMRGIALSACALLLFVIVLLAWRAWPLIAAQPLGALLTGRAWHPARGQFGFAPFVIGSAAVTLVAMVFAVVPAILSGIYLAEYTSSRIRALLKPLLDLLVAIPSVVYGLWGILFIVPLLRDQIGPWVEATFGDSIPLLARTNPSGYGLLTAGFVLGVMVFPLVVAVTDEVLRSIPREMREAALCLGATRWEATKTILRHRAAPGVAAAIVLGFSRAFGETLAVMMLVGNTPHIPASLFDGAYTLSGLIANNYGEMMSVPLYESALMGAALLLLLVVLVFNILARLVIIRLGKEQ